MTRHQEQMEVATFNGKTDILVKADFAAVAQLQASHTTTCEWPTGAHENVALVLHSLLPFNRLGLQDRSHVTSGEHGPMRNRMRSL